MREIWLLLDSRGMGGIESHVAELAAGLAAAGDAARVIFLRDHGPHPLRDRLDRLGIAHDSLRGGLSGLVRRLRRDRPGVLHTHGYKANIVGRIAGRLTGTPTVATYHAGEACTGRVGLYDRLDRWTSWMGGRIAVSAPILGRLPFGAQLVPNFVAVPEAAVAPSAGTIGFVGRLVPEKGPDRFRSLAEQRPDLSHLVFGDGPMRPMLEADAPPTLCFMGMAPSMDPHWRDIGLLVISSRAEGLPLAALEAMAHGVPVAAFALGGLPELITDGRDGFLAPADDLAALSDAVGRWRALSGPERHAMAQAARETVRRRYGRAAGVAAVRAVYAAAGVTLDGTSMAEPLVSPG